MAGLVPAIHVFLPRLEQRRGCPAPVSAGPGIRSASVASAKTARPGMTSQA